LAKQRVSHRVHTYQHDPRAESYGLEAATALGIDPTRCFKTLIADVDGQLVVGVVPVTGSLDLKRLAMAAGGKRAAMAEPVLAERATGYVRGGISPLGQRKRLPVVLDASAQRHETIYVSGGRRGLEVELAPADLLRLTAGHCADIATG
jgi:Cys-tRNA(Pro)/Cys-tRNA(Cys) deacylase